MSFPSPTKHLKQISLRSRFLPSSLSASSDCFFLSTRSVWLFSSFSPRLHPSYHICHSFSITSAHHSTICPSVVRFPSQICTKLKQKTTAKRLHFRLVMLCGKKRDHSSSIKSFQEALRCMFLILAGLLPLQL